MKLSKIYSNVSTFKEVIFNDNFNIILGDIKDLDNMSKDSHNLGKSKLIDLIDFLFLKELKKGNFLKNDKFKNHIFFIEVLLKKDELITIRRAIKDNTKVSIIKHTNRYQDFTNLEPSKWEYSNLTIKSSIPEKNANIVLNNLLQFNVLTTRDYRQTFNYFFRSQNDYSDLFRLSKFVGKDVYWKPILYELLGFSSEHMIYKYELDSQKEEIKDRAKKIERDFSINEHDVDLINGKIIVRVNERNNIKEDLDAFDFYEQDVTIEEDLVYRIESEISNLNSEKYKLDYEINDIRDSLEIKDVYDIDKMRNLYSEVEITLPELLVKSFEEFVWFNKKVFEERRIYLIEALDLKTNKLKEINSLLTNLNKERVKLMSVYLETDTFKKYNKLRDSLIKVEKEISELELKLKNANTLMGIKSQIDETELLIKKQEKELSNQVLNNSNNVYELIRSDFSKFVKEVINQDAVISIQTNQNGNIEFIENILDENFKVTSQKDGHTYKKLLCASFDLALVKAYSDKSFYRTVYHDGIMESLDPRKQKLFWELARRISNENDIQYILTVLKNDIPLDEKGNPSYSQHEIAVQLNDLDDSGRLFGFEF